MNPPLKTQIGVRTLAAICATLGLLWLVSFWVVAAGKGGRSLSLFWLGVCFLEPLVGILFTLIAMRVHVASGGKDFAWTAVAVLSGLAPIGIWLLLWVAQL